MPGRSEIAGTDAGEQLLLLLIEKTQIRRVLLLLIDLDGLIDPGLLIHLLLGLDQQRPLSGQQAGQQVIQ